MEGRALKTSIRTIFIASLIGLFTIHGAAQSQAINGQIEGTISDKNGAVVPNAIVNATNLENGAVRTAITDSNGIYRFPLLPLGMYRIAVDAVNFRRAIRDGITLTAGQTATIDIVVEIGELNQEVKVFLDSSIAEAGKTNLSRVMNSREVQNLPLISRNPYNFALLQANVNGRPNRGFGFPNVNANGYTRRINYQLDGMANTQSDRAGVRLMFVSDTQVSEVQLVTNGFAAEFGNTPGLIMNVLTPSGTNRLSGTFSYRFRLPSFYSRPFFYPSNERLPDNKTNDVTATLGAPIIKDRLHIYFGYEYINRDNKASADQLLTITDANRAGLMAAGLPASIFPTAIPSHDIVSFYFVRSDLQANANNRVAVRFNRFDLVSRNFVVGGFNTLERSVDTLSPGHSLGIQLVTYNSEILNELRFEYAQRKTDNRRNTYSGWGPSVVISNVANFGSPDNADTINPLEKVTQIQDNLTWERGTHQIKFGGGFDLINDFKRSAIFARYTFASIGTYLAARTGINPQSYTSYVEAFGDPDIKYKSTFWNFFVQDDWKVTRRLKVNFGLRYDLYVIPNADTASPLDASRRFNVDKNNFAPRVGIAYALREGRRSTIVRAGFGLYYETPWLNMYERAIRNNGLARFINLSFSPGTAGAPTFPNTFSGTRPAGTLPPQNIDTIAPDFENMYAVHSMLQLEQAVTTNLSFAIGFVNSGGRHIAVYRNINLIPQSYLSDGRPVFSRLPLPLTRFDPRFNNIFMAEAAGVSQYNALSLQVTHRLDRGIQFGANYTFSKATDDAPEQNLSTGAFQNLILTDPFNRRLDKGRSFADQRHTFELSFVAGPRFNFKRKLVRSFLDNNQVSIIATANSGETFNIVSTSDINNDGMTGLDRPVGIRRNSGTTPAQFDVDLRYSRFFNFSEHRMLEVFGEFQNLFNINSIVQFSNVSVTTGPNGEIIGGIPSFKTPNNSMSQDSRQVQIGFRLNF